MHKYDEQWFISADEETRRRIVDQDMVRRDAERAIERENDPEPQSPAKLAFVRLCCQQVIENMRAYNLRNSAAVGLPGVDAAAPYQRHLTKAEADAALERLRTSLGVTSTESNP